MDGGTGRRAPHRFGCRGGQRSHAHPGPRQREGPVQGPHVVRLTPPYRLCRRALPHAGAGGGFRGRSPVNDGRIFQTAKGVGAPSLSVRTGGVAPAHAKVARAPAGKRTRPDRAAGRPRRSSFLARRWGLAGQTRRRLSAAPLDPFPPHGRHLVPPQRRFSEWESWRGC